jgi:uncharacterized protein YjbI with pentapeptide repeats
MNYLRKMTELAKKNKVKTIGLGIVVFGLLGLATQQQLDFFTGFGGDTDITNFLHEKEKNGSPKIAVTKDKVTKFDIKRKVTVDGNDFEIVTTIAKQEPKKLWDWLSLLGVPVALAIFAAYLNHLQQESERRREELAEAEADRKTQAEKAIAETRQQEEAFQNYIDRMSALLIDKNLVGMADRENKMGWPYPEQKDLLEASVCVIRSRTLSILRRLHGNLLLKTNVIRFLIDSEVLTKLGVDLCDADLRGVDFSDENFSGINFTETKINFRGVKFQRCDFRNVRFDDACLVGREFKDPEKPLDNKIDFRGANFENAVFSKSDLSDADFREAILKTAEFQDVRLGKADFSGSDLGNAKFSGDFSLLEKSRFDKAWLTSTSFENCSGGIILGNLIGSAKLCEVVFPVNRDLIFEIPDPNRDCGQPPRFLGKGPKIFEES